MTSDSRHLSVHVDRPVSDVYAFVSNPANLPRWAPGLGTSVVRENGAWFVDTPDGRAQVTFAPANDLGVLDHHVLTPTGDTVYMPVRAIADDDGCEVVFTVRRAPGMTDAEYDRDLSTVTEDLHLLKQVVESTTS